MHSILFINVSDTSYTVVIDGAMIMFSRAMNKIKYGDCEALSEYVDAVERIIKAGEVLAPLSITMNGVNMLRLLKALYKEKTEAAWLAYVSQDPAKRVRQAYYEFFGYLHNSTVHAGEYGTELTRKAIAVRQSILADELAKKKEKLEADHRYYRRNKAIGSLVGQIDKELSASKDWIVERRGLFNNVVSYTVNKYPFDMCLSGHTALDSAKNVANLLADLQDAFALCDSKKVHYVIDQFGGKVAFQLLDVFFHDEAKSFFADDFRKTIIAKRDAPKPNSYLKLYFGGSCGHSQLYHIELLKTLESQIPTLEKYLIRSSRDEMRSESRDWRVFYYERSRLRQCTIRFPDRQPLQKEMKQFYTYLYNLYSTSERNENAFSHICAYNSGLLKMIESDGFDHLSSARDFTLWDFKNYIAIMVKERESVQTIRRDLFRIKRFLSFVDSVAAEKCLPLSIFPSPAVNPRRPIDSSIINRVAEYKDELPEYIWLAFQVFTITGARAGSVFELAVNDLIKLNDKWVVHMYYEKAAERKAEVGVPSYVTHELPEALARSLLAYIQKTESLRALLPRQYVFVYESPRFRADSARMPHVLDSGRFSDALRNLCINRCIYDSDGTIPAWSGQSIRAEVGRSLFSKGASPETVAAKLGNTPSVAKMHYDSMYPADEANMRRALYEQTLEVTVTQASCPAISKITPMYGSCDTDKECHNKNDCRNCSQRIEKRT